MLCSQPAEDTMYLYVFYSKMFDSYSTKSLAAFTSFPILENQIFFHMQNKVFYLFSNQRSFREFIISFLEYLTPLAHLSSVSFSELSFPILQIKEIWPPPASYYSNLKFKAPRDKALDD